MKMYLLQAQETVRKQNSTTELDCPLLVTTEQPE